MYCPFVILKRGRLARTRLSPKLSDLRRRSSVQNGRSELLLNNWEGNTMVVLAYRHTTNHGRHVDNIYRSERRANEYLQAKGSEKDKGGKERLYELCQMRLSLKLRTNVPSVMWAMQNGRSSGEEHWAVKKGRKEEGRDIREKKRAR